MTRIRRFSAATVIFILLLSIFNVRAASAESYEIVIDSISAKKSGFCEIIGHIEGAPLDTQVACVVARESVYNGNEINKDEFTIENVAWIDQVGTGNNGTFLIQFSINALFSNTTLAVRLGSGITDVCSGTIDIPDLTNSIGIVDNNSVLYGRDIFYVPGKYYTPDNIAESLGYGGNNVYFKIGDMWYNLMDERAVDNSFLTEENAVSEEEVEVLFPRYYYSAAEQIMLNYYA